MLYRLYVNVCLFSDVNNQGKSGEHSFYLGKITIKLGMVVGELSPW